MGFLRLPLPLFVLFNTFLTTFIVGFLITEHIFYKEITNSEMKTMCSKILTEIWTLLIFVLPDLSDISINILVILTLYISIKIHKILIEIRINLYNETQNYYYSKRVSMFILSLILISIVTMILLQYSKMDFVSFHVSLILYCFFKILFHSLICDALQQIFCFVHSLYGFQWKYYTLTNLTIKSIDASLTSFTLFNLFKSLLPTVFIGILVFSIMRFYKSIKSVNQLMKYISYSYLLDQLPLVHYDSEEEHECVICRDTLTEAVHLSCGHDFHVSCLKEWLSGASDCPICRSHINLNENEEEEQVEINPTWNVHEI
ncbi:hypothetical protein, conserved [Entamoeba dispar SAW760]|uniref:RING-type domain-containing protein n=1 Tax=Entamoeba dispar (strain ATCC PRA-260 / SAW760) TaxID=370354 RepID=B0EU34_ENTDS|nr:uncharacterized protein EDI_272860 [Entamoeba dispar SAW760]EDR21951.1 hypothetical protein, conserved [Entamoeba dispar SAW760]|eukprot:EDR21951.1 hypothetical protein, conserved [Entamoeba dispar SAW760]